MRNCRSEFATAKHRAIDRLRHRKLADEGLGNLDPVLVRSELDLSAGHERTESQHRIVRRVPAFDAARKVMKGWLAPRGEHTMLPVRGTDALLRAWAVRRPNGSVSVLLLNKAPQPRTVRVGDRTMTLPADSITVANAGPASRASRAPAARGQRRR